MKIVDTSGGVVACIVTPVQIESVTAQQKVDKTLRFVRRL